MNFNIFEITYLIKNFRNLLSLKNVQIICMDIETSRDNFNICESRNLDWFSRRTSVHRGRNMHLTFDLNSNVSCLAWPETIKESSLKKKRKKEELNEEIEYFC